MFGTLLEKLQTAFSSLFSTSFLLGNFFPVLIIAIVNFAFAWLGLDRFAELASAWNPVNGTTTAAAEFVLLILLAVLLGPLVPLLRSLLGGENLLRFLRARGDKFWETERARREQKSETAKEDYTFFTEQRDTAIPQLQQARAQGNQNLANTDEPALDVAAQRIQLITTQMLGSRLPEQAALENAVAGLAQALQRNSTADGNPHQDLSHRLERLHSQMLDCLDLAKDIAYRNAELANYTLLSSFVPNEIWPTRVGNARAALERYPTVAYNVAYDFLWPRLQMVLLKQKDISAMVDTANAKLEFAVLMTWLSALTVAVWMPLIAFVGHSLSLYFVVGILGPAAVILFYLLVDETQKAFGKVMVMVVDALHFDLLTALHQRIPNTLSAERENWMQLQRALYAEGVLDLHYHHPKVP
jgi:hypothetical protein